MVNVYLGEASKEEFKTGRKTRSALRGVKIHSNLSNTNEEISKPPFTTKSEIKISNMAHSVENKKVI